MSKEYLIFLFACGSIGAQSLQVLPSPPSGNRSGSFQIMIVSPKEKSPAALQWSMSASSGVAIEGKDIHSGSAADQAKKSLTCGSSTDSSSGKSGAVVNCALAGGVSAIPNGAIAIVRFAAREGIDTLSIRLERVLGATADGKPVAFRDVEATIPLKTGAPK